MLTKGDLKFRLKGKRLNGDFALIHIKARRPGSKGNEWLLIKKKDDHVVAPFDIDAFDTSILTNRTMAQIAGDDGSAEWKSSRPASRGKTKALWLAEAIERADSKRKPITAESAEGVEKNKGKKATPSSTKARTSPTISKTTRGIASTQLVPKKKVKSRLQSKL